MQARPLSFEKKISCTSAFMDSEEHEEIYDGDGAGDWVSTIIKIRLHLTGSDTSTFRFDRVAGGGWLN